jgi:DNA-binding MarR family transcriptional regulator
MRASTDHVDEIIEQWRRERPDLDPRPMGVFGRFARLAAHLDRELTAGVAPFGLERWEFDVLATLRRSGAPYELTAGQLVASAMLTSGAITNRIDRLADRGLIERRADPADRRVVRVGLLPAGRELVDRAVEAHLDNERRLLAALGPRDQEQLARLLRRLLATFEPPAP